MVCIQSNLWSWHGLFVWYTKNNYSNLQPGLLERNILGDANGAKCHRTRSTKYFKSDRLLPQWHSISAWKTNSSSSSSSSCFFFFFFLEVYSSFKLSPCTSFRAFLRFWYSNSSRAALQIGATILVSLQNCCSSIAHPKCRNKSATKRIQIAKRAKNDRRQNLTVNNWK